MLWAKNTVGYSKNHPLINIPVNFSWFSTKLQGERIITISGNHDVILFGAFYAFDSLESGGIFYVIFYIVMHQDTVILNVKSTEVTRIRTTLSEGHESRPGCCRLHTSDTYKIEDLPVTNPASQLLKSYKAVAMVRE